MRRGGRSLAEIARAEIGPLAGGTASLAILFVVIIALSGLGVVVVKALGGEEVKLAARHRAGTARRRMPAESIRRPTDRDFAATLPRRQHDDRLSQRRAGARAASRSRSAKRASSRTPAEADVSTVPLVQAGNRVTLPDGVTQAVPGSSWGTFTIACTIPIALFVGLYMYKIRKGRVVEASAIGAVGVLAATVAGNWIPGSALEQYFSLSREADDLGHLPVRLHRLGAAGVAAAVPARLPVELPEDRHRRAAGRRR